MQKGVCPICSAALVFGGRTGAHVDHDHDTGKVRGVLCCNCNPGLGHFDHDVDVLQRAIDYLKGS